MPRRTDSKHRISVRFAPAKCIFIIITRPGVTYGYDMRLCVIVSCYNNMTKSNAVLCALLPLQPTIARRAEETAGFRFHS